MSRLNPIHGHGNTTKKGRQTQPKRLGLENRKVSKCQATDNSECPVAFGVTLLSIHNAAKILRNTKLPKGFLLNHSFVPKPHKPRTPKYICHCSG